VKRDPEKHRAWQERPLERTEMERSRTPIAQMSDKAKAKIPGRRRAMIVVRERDKVCQFWVRLVVWAQTTGAVEFPESPIGQDGHVLLARCQMAFDYPTPECFGPLEGHEPKKRSGGADIENPDEIVLLCQGHNGWVEDYPEARKLLGL
jgi:hypothetical protein